MTTQNTTQETPTKPRRTPGAVYVLVAGTLLMAGSGLYCGYNSDKRNDVLVYKNVSSLSADLKKLEEMRDDSTNIFSCGSLANITTELESQISARQLELDCLKKTPEFKLSQEYDRKAGYGLVGSLGGLFLLFIGGALILKKL